MGTQLPSWWRKYKRLLITAIIIMIVVLPFAFVHWFGWNWTGFKGKTLWDFLQLLIIPAVLAGAGYIINLTISRGEQAATEQRAKTEREIAQDNQRETTLK